MNVYHVSLKNTGIKRHNFVQCRSKNVQLSMQKQYRKKEMLSNCVGFINATKIRVDRSSGTVHHRSVCSRHKRVHSLSCQAIETTDGIVFRTYGPVK